MHLLRKRLHLPPEIDQCLNEEGHLAGTLWRPNLSGIGAILRALATRSAPINLALKQNALGPEGGAALRGHCVCRGRIRAHALRRLDQELR